MLIERTVSAEDVKSVLCHPDIYPLISDEHCPSPEEWEPPMRDVLYLKGQTDRTIAIGAFHPFWNGLKFHPNVLDRKYANEFIRRCLNFVDKPVYIEIPERLEKLALHFGFEEICRDSKIVMRLL